MLSASLRGTYRHIYASKRVTDFEEMVMVMVNVDLYSAIITKVSNALKCGKVTNTGPLQQSDY